jgi:beta-phosphoglucomutase family hydrolase
MPHTSPIGAIFDWDGVIVDSADHHLRSWELLAAEERLSLPPDHFKQGFGRKNERIIPGILHWTDEPAEIARLSKRKEALFRELMQREGVVLLPGVRELLKGLGDAGIPCAVGSSTHAANLDAAFEQLGIRRHFQAVITGEDVSQGKPDPEVFLLAAKRIGVAPERCVVFEDAPAGVEAGRNGGMRVIALRTTNPVELLSAADLIVRDLSEVTVETVRSLHHGAHRVHRDG